MTNATDDALGLRSTGGNIVEVLWPTNDAPRTIWLTSHDAGVISAFQDQEGEERGVTEVVAGDVQFLAPRKAGTRIETAGGQQAASDNVSPDEIPF